jgi:hypothetical protein
LDPARLARALDSAVAFMERLDYRTRLLVSDSVATLERHWGRSAFGRWLRESPVGRRIETIRHEHFEEVGFPSLERRIKNGAESSRPCRTELVDSLPRGVVANDQQLRHRPPITSVLYHFARFKIRAANHDIETLSMPGYGWLQVNLTPSHRNLEALFSRSALWRVKGKSLSRLAFATASFYTMTTKFYRIACSLIHLRIRSQHYTTRVHDRCFLILRAIRLA